MELRFFGGLNVGETAEVLKISPETVMRDWKFAKGWLMRELLAGQGAEHMTVGQEFLRLTSPKALDAQ